MSAGSGPDPGRRAIRGAVLLSLRQILVGLVTAGGIVALPLLLTPAEFSLYGYVNTIVLVAAAVGDLGLGAGIIRGGASDRELRGSLALQLAFWIPVCALCAAAGAVIQPFGFSALTVSLLCLALLLLSLQALPTALLERHMAFKRISALEVAQRVILVGTAIALAATEPAQWSIPLAVALAALLGYPAFLIGARWRWAPRFAAGEPLFRGFSSEWWQVRILNQLAYAVYPLLGGILFTADEVGLIVWALGVTSIPAYLAPTIARAVFPALAHAEEERLTGIYSRMFRGLLLISLPLVVGLVVASEPITKEIFGPDWVDGIPLLRLESVTTTIGLALTPVVPLLFLVLDPKRVKWLMAVGTAGLILLSIALAPLISYKAISVASIVYASAVMAVIDLWLRRASGYSPLRDAVPSLIALAVAAAAGFGAISLSGSLAWGLACGAGAAALQLGLSVLLSGGVDLRQLIAEIRSSEATNVPGDPGPSPR